MTGDPTYQPLIIERVFAAPPMRVWQAWSDPEQVKRWWGPADFTSPTCSIDFREGGKYLFCMQAPDGKQFWSTGTYKEIVPNKRIVMTDSFADEKGNVVPAAYYGMSDETPLELRITLMFEEQGGTGSGAQTKLTLHHEGLPAGDMIDQTRAGWNTSLDKLAASLG